MVTHGNLLNLIAWHQRSFNVTPTDRGTLYASPGFDSSVWELWPYLATGASVHVVGDTIRTVPEALRDWILLPTIQSRSASGTVRIVSPTTCTLAPVARYGHSSQTDASKPGLAYKVPRSLGVTLNARRCQLTRLRRLPWVICTPFGLPVEPEVKMTYARLSGFV